MESQSPWYPNYVLCALARFASFGSRTALTQQNRELNYTQARQLVLDLADRLRTTGVRPGDVVGVFMGLQIESPLLQLALHLVGVRSVWIDITAMPNEIDQYLKVASVDVLIYDARTVAEPGAALGRRLGVPVLCLGPDGAGPDLLAPGPTVDQVPVATDAPVESIFQTSGTTGVPKSVHHRHVFYAQLGELADELVAADQWRTRHLSFSRLSHPAGQISSLLYLFSGGTLVFVPTFEPGDFIAAIVRERPTSVYMAPPMFYQILDHPSLADADLSSLTTFNIGGSALNPTRVRQGIDRFGPILRVTYGLSESPFITAYPNVGTDPDRVRSCGRTYGDVRVEIRDEAGSPVGIGETGELWVWSRLNFAGYWGQPDLTAAALVDGWVRTRDLAYQDADDYLYLVGRTSDMILAGVSSKCVYPRPIEDILATHPHVRAAAVIGVPDEAQGEAVHAFVVREPNVTVTEDELVTLVRGQLHPSWAPRTIDFVDSLPTTAIGKVNTRALRDRYARDHQRAVRS
ncbi:MAG TPA: AMP-binding protein [Pseudonocardiaceae bacterium]|jgi:acyl-CoA synthetase (AMP-forming)/AMP-acid ligase II